MHPCTCRSQASRFVQSARSRPRSLPSPSTLAQALVHVPTTPASWTRFTSWPDGARRMRNPRSPLRRPMSAPRTSSSDDVVGGPHARGATPPVDVYVDRDPDLALRGDRPRGLHGEGALAAMSARSHLAKPARRSAGRRARTHREARARGCFPSCRGTRRCGQPRRRVGERCPRGRCGSGLRRLSPRTDRWAQRKSTASPSTIDERGGHGAWDAR